MKILPTPVHSAAINGLAAWTRDSFPQAEDWVYRMPPAVVEEFDRAIRAICDQGKDLASINAEDFPAPSFQQDAQRLRRELLSGRGFVVIKGFPVERYTTEQAGMIYWGLGSLLGAALPQNVKGERLYSVRDEGQSIQRDYGTVGVRFSKTTEGLSFHTDSAPVLMGNTPDIVALLALRVARSGGASALVSAPSVHNVLLRERPDLLARLYRCFHFDRRAELRPGESPTLFAPIFRYANALEVRYFRFYIPKGHELAGVPLEPADVEAMNCLESVMNREELQVRFEMEPGDMQFVNNRFILHSRTAFEDHPEPQRRRHLMRLWLKTKETPEAFRQP